MTMIPGQRLSWEHRGRPARPRRPCETCEERAAAATSFRHGRVVRQCFPCWVEDRRASEGVEKTEAPNGR